MKFVNQRPDLGRGIERMPTLSAFTRAVSFSMNRSAMLSWIRRRLDEVQRSPLSE